jgi:hypothetical protein
MFDHPLCGVQQKLQRGESLLSVHDVPNRDEPRRVHLLIQHDRAKEVRRYFGRAKGWRWLFKYSFSNSSNVVP